MLVERQSSSSVAENARVEAVDRVELALPEERD
jgi:hypothetical protein